MKPFLSRLICAIISVFLIVDVLTLKRDDGLETFGIRRLQPIGRHPYSYTRARGIRRQDWLAQLPQPPPNEITDPTPKLSKRGKPWTAVQDEVLQAKREQGLSYKQIRKEIFPDRSLGALRNRYSELRRGQTALTKGERIDSWTTKDDRRLLDLNKGKISWRDLREKHFPDRTPSAIKARYFALTQDPSVPKAERKNGWTTDDENRLLDLKVEQDVTWRDLKKHFPGRTLGAIKARYYALTRDPSVPDGERKDAWTTEEDERLVKLREEDGLSWPDVDKYFSGRSKGALQMRYHKLTSDPAASREKARVLWTPEEDDRLLMLIQEGTFTWEEMAEDFPGRSARALIMRHYKLKQRKKDREEQRQEYLKKKKKKGN